MCLEVASGLILEIKILYIGGYLLGLGAESREEEGSVGRLQQTCLTFPREEGGSVGEEDAKHNVFIFLNLPFEKRRRGR